MHELRSRLESLRTKQPNLNLYALVDGLQYEQHTGNRLNRSPGFSLALFDGTPDAALAHAGPWLLNEEQAAPKQVETIYELEAAKPAVVWLIASSPMLLLGMALTKRLEVTMPDGSHGLMRFYDPRTLQALVNTLDHEQRQEFFGCAEEWHILIDGRRARLGGA
ncbi:DUF4123 domain-containing protein [Chitinimonas sp. PSY-7]|uniref:DUF4123 domain-containing protein n=1 Tax=Chitinimonas sp. PSY-7 TaxID=3459088 RepID=UPI004040010E